MKAQVEKIFDDLERYHDFCRFELREFNPSHLYDKANDNYRAFLYNQRPKSSNSFRNDNRKRDTKRYEQNFSR